MEVRINVDGLWKTVEVTDAEVKTCMRSAFEKNVKIIEQVKKLANDKTAAEQAVIATTLVRHYWFDVEEFARNKTQNKSKVPAVPKIDPKPAAVAEDFGTDFE